MKLENGMGNLRDIYPYCIPGTMQHVDQLTQERLNTKELRGKGFYTADGLVSYWEHNKPLLYIVRERVNPIFLHLDDAFGQLATKNNYAVLADDFELLKKDPETIVLDLMALELVEDKIDQSYGYFSIPTTKPISAYNSEQQKFMLRVFGFGEDYDVFRMMLALCNWGASRIQFYVLNPTYVQEHALEHPIARVSWLACGGNFTPLDKSQLLGIRDGIVRAEFRKD